MPVTGYVVLFTRQVKCAEFSRCYDDINICFWTDGSVLTRHEAQTACQQRHSSFLPRITNSDIRSKLVKFRSNAGNLLYSIFFWIDVYAVPVDSFHWIDGSILTGLSVSYCP